MTPKKNKGKFPAKLKKIWVFCKSSKLECIMCLIGCLFIYRAFYVQSKIAFILICIVIILTGFLVGRFNYEKIEEKLEIMMKMNYYVLPINITLMAFLNKIEQVNDLENSAVSFVIGILALPFLSMFIFFQLQMEKDINSSWFKFASLILYWTIMLVSVLFVYTIYENIKHIL